MRGGGVRVLVGAGVAGVAAARALGILGLGDQVADRAVRIRRQRTADHQGRVLFDVDVDELWNGVGPCLALHRA
ncbi:hypothetical protein [Pseudonocardia asaccharolytica]|uniref:Uncharacterized protein n=1 Tax=Pseudonocardia asaccharolytica DSM 44247 = NBRC 16224 TaxID=1123024 RepID=A0A511D778_9PSEU|nr:hypothetical protein [Pseudonocardia asaccharolytica]GEL20649.1 hypothetical protein PA7_44860 [Pseudonocardia asaccharolytica DSM 44247 = NBRC 16224]